MPLPLKRPFALWLPAFLLLFLLWVWGLSCYHSFQFIHWDNTRDRSKSIKFTYGSSRLEFIVTRARGELSGEPSSGTRYLRKKIPGDEAASWFPLPRLTRSDRSIPGLQAHTYHLILPLWVLALFYLALWWAALRWHARRQRRLRQAEVDTFHLTRSAPDPQTD
jgi:hypothetical protein